MIYTDDKYIRSVLPARKADAHKGDFGKVLIYAGSPGMAGAAVLCGSSALKSGAGLVQYLLNDLSSPLLPILQISVPEATCRAASKVSDINEYTVIAAGCGLGKTPEAARVIESLLNEYRGCLVLDADALNLISESPVLTDLVISCEADIIITPHIGEAGRLLHTCEGIKGLEARKRAAEALSEKYRCTAVLKGAGTLVAQYDPKSRPCVSLFQNTTGNPGMATGGSGDCLTGIIAGLAAQKLSPADAARTGVFIHGRAGDLAAAELGEISVSAGDIVHFIPYAIKEYYGGDPR